MDEEDGDVNWEDESGGEGESEEVVSEGGGQKLNEDPISISITVGPKQKSKRGEKKDANKRVVFTEEDYEDCFQRCEYDFEERTLSDLSVARACIDTAVLSEVADILPVTLTEIQQPERPFDRWIAMIRWMRDTFRTVSVKDMTVEEGRDGSHAKDLIDFVLKNKAGSRHQLNQVFIAAMLTMHYRVRMVTTVDPVSWSPQEHADVYRTRWEASQGENSTAKFKDRKYAKPGEKCSWLEVFYDPTSPSCCGDMTMQASTVVDLSGAVDLTGEVEVESPTMTNRNTSTAAPSSSNKPCYTSTKTSCTTKQARWVHVDPHSQRIDLPTHAEEVLRKAKPLQYVIAFEFQNNSNAGKIGYSKYPSNSSSSSSGSSSSSCSSKSTGTNPSNAPPLCKHSAQSVVKVVDVTSTYKRQHHYSTRRDKEARARMESWLTAHIQQLNKEESIRIDSTPVSLSGSKCNSNSNSNSNSNKVQSSVDQPYDLCDIDGNDDIVDLTADDCDNVVSEVQDLAGKNNYTANSAVNSSSNTSSRSSSSSQPLSTFDNYYTDVVDFTEDDIDIVVSPASSSAKRTRSEFEANTHSSTSDNIQDIQTEIDLTSCPLPSRLQDFKDHPMYCLARHVLSEQALHPNAQTVGVFKGESVYLQHHKETLRTKLQWRCVLKQVRRSEEPIKVVQRRVRTLDNSNGGGGQGQAGGRGEDKTIELKLFGSWQTEPIQIPPVVDGIIPVNSHGNIEVWEGRAAFVPSGAVYIDNPSAIKTARQLELPCAPAVVGFERRGLHTVPILGGVVVLRQHAALVSDAAFFVAAVREENVYAKKDKEMTTKWERMVYGVLSREKLRERYGH